MQRTDLVDLIESRGNFISREAAHDATQATLRTLGERISGGEASDLAERLPEDFAGPILTAGGEAEAFPPSEFVDRVDQREAIEMDDTDAHARAVLTSVAERLDQPKWEDATTQLPTAYEPLLRAVDGGVET